MLSDIVSDKLELLFVTETKVDTLFLTSSFLMPGFPKPLKLDRSTYGGGSMLFIRENITFKSLPDILVPVNIECLFVSLIIRKKKSYLIFSKMSRLL